jgi:glycosyltransferase involved in cell wall biosynthesis
MTPPEPETIEARLRAAEAEILGLRTERDLLIRVQSEPVRTALASYLPKLRRELPDLATRRRAFDEQMAVLQGLIARNNVIGTDPAAREARLQQMELRLNLLLRDLETVATFHRSSFGFRLWHFLRPRVGMLDQHLSRVMFVPYWYSQEALPPDPPRISVVVPSFNHGAFLEATLQSLLSQGYPALEVIVCDGGSTDDSADILRRYAGRLAYWCSEPDEGQAHAINKGMARATGEILAYLNSDDLLLPGALHRAARCFRQRPDVDVVYGHRVLVDKHGFEIGRWVLPPHDDETLHYADYIPQETLFWRRALWEKAGGRMDPTYQFALDWELLLRFQDNGGRFFRIPRFLGCFRVHEEQKTSARIADVGQLEMMRCREYAHGRPVAQSEVSRGTRWYRWRSRFYHLLYRCEILKY